MEGRASYKLAIVGGGRVASVSVTPSGSIGGSAVSCMQNVLRSLAFDEPESGTATITGVFTFVRTIDPPTPPRSPSPTPDMLGLGGGRPFQPPTTTALIRASDDAWRTEGEDALTKLRDAAQKSPTSRKALETLVRGLLARGRYEQALAEARRFATSDPDLAVARDLLAYAAVLSGDAKAALAAVDAAVESDPRSVKGHLRAANAFEAAGDERRACAHWRSLATLSKVEDYRAEALRCRARSLGDRDAALAEAKSIEKPGAKLAKLLPLLESGQVAAFAADAASPGQFEVKIECTASDADCPIVAVIAPNGTVYSPSVPADARVTSRSVAFSALRDGTYRVVLLGGAAEARGEITVRAAGSTQKMPFARGGTQTLAAVQVSIPPLCCWGLDRLNMIGIGGGW